MQVTSAIGEGSAAVISSSDQWEVNSIATLYLHTFKTVLGVQ